MRKFVSQQKLTMYYTGKYSTCTLGANVTFAVITNQKLIIKIKNITILIYNSTCKEIVLIFIQMIILFFFVLLFYD